MVDMGLEGEREPQVNIREIHRRPVTPRHVARPVRRFLENTTARAATRRMSISIRDSSSRRLRAALALLNRRLRPPLPRVEHSLRRERRHRFEFVQLLASRYSHKCWPLNQYLPTAEAIPRVNEQN
jgi:hypothetical protein